MLHGLQNAAVMISRAKKSKIVDYVFDMRFQGLMAVSMRITVFWDVVHDK